VNFASCFVLTLVLEIYETIFIDDFLAVEKKYIYNVGKNIVDCRREGPSEAGKVGYDQISTQCLSQLIRKYLFCYVFFSHAVYPPAYQFLCRFPASVFQETRHKCLGILSTNFLIEYMKQNV
jgi:hypothetical protein